ncbi:MAG: hypothetical protein PHH01_00765 [Patescibacteria group bacterium]|nr:hypothetical protein [Patescibacteria group bacterium]
MKVFIFGAGASKGSKKPTHSIPDNVLKSRVSPITDELFNQEYESYAGEVKLSTSNLVRYRNEIKEHESLEKWITEKWNNKNSHSDFRKKGENGEFGKISMYIWRLFQGVSVTYNYDNYYRRLMQKLYNDDIKSGFISFNYDTLLDLAITEVFNVPLTGLDEYYDINYIKPHGSINWFIKKRSIDPTGSNVGLTEKYNIAASRMFNGDPHKWENIFIVPPTLEALNTNDFINNGRFDHEYGYPLIFLPLRIKQYELVENYYSNIIERGIGLLAEASEIYIIGYSARDEIVKDLFGKVKPETIIHIISYNSAHKISDEIKKWKPEIKIGHLYNNGFANFVEYEFENMINGKN